MKRASAMLVISLAFLTVYAASAAYADQPQVVTWHAKRGENNKGTYKAVSSSGGDHQIQVKLALNKEFTAESFLVVFPRCGEDLPILHRPISNLPELLADKSAAPKYAAGWSAPKPRWRACADVGAVLLMPKQRQQTIGVLVDFLANFDGGVNPRLIGQVYSVTKEALKLAGQDTAKLAMLLVDQQPAAEVIIDLYYTLRTKNKSWSWGSYQTVFGKGQSDLGDDIPEVVEYSSIADSVPVDTAGFQRMMKLPRYYADDSGALLEQTYQLILSSGAEPDSTTVCHTSNEYGYPSETEIQDIHTKIGMLDTLVSGNFNVEWSTDRSIHPGWGWLAEVWSDDTGAWAMIGSGYVEADGRFSIYISGADTGFMGARMRIVFRSKNVYFRIQDRDQNSYSFRTRIFEGVPQHFDTGIFTGRGNNGVAELANAAMTLWSALDNRGGINPVPASPIKINFPNTWYECSPGSIWSCANINGNIWLIAAHGTDPRVVNHELAHQLNNKYWDKKLPANTGGAHNYNGCYPGRLGMTLREGFANFIPAWVAFENRVFAASTNYMGQAWNFGYNLENRAAPPNCANGYENEVWVARTFWDLHDGVRDGDDTLRFIRSAAVPVLFLRNGIEDDGDARDIRDYESIYQDSVAPEHDAWVANVFTQNRM